ncbi:CCA tRNA nucleotidyltransferase [Raoultibacter phocaeensis]|uniref:CCA tRNA nucleotidyltransferase n=1 Tax=Raoultibacter phocaeensis TaxID=2479841 RepID=UPI001118F639|nr:HD domain-containing protein [Raoultibacter phocaeensis]
MCRDHTSLSLRAPARQALGALENAGYEAWIVGGFVRDALMGRASGDIDIATSAPWQEAARAFAAQGLRVHETGIAHGTITVIVSDEPIEVTTYRADGTYTDSRHPDTVEFVNDIAADLKRRDFTMNAVAYHPRRGLFDPEGGVPDIEAGLIRAVGDPSRRFGEDALRILRACRFSSQLGFAIESATMRAMESCAPLLSRIASERTLKELQGFVCGEHVYDALMACADVLASVIGELKAMKGFDQKTPYHIYDVLEHTAYAMQNTPAYPLVRWAALFHDMGKPRTFFTDDAGIGHFYGHATVSVELAEPVMKRLGMPSALSSDIIELVTRHDDDIEPTPKAVKRALRRLGGRVDLFRALCDLKRGDALAQAPHCHNRVALADELDRALDAILEAEEAFSLKDLAIKGGDVIALGIAPGPEVGRLLEEALEAVIDERVPNERAALTAFVRMR